ncbi:unnamed protein product [Meloidogyne enterolobii]|uniref:Uncharacterized protein n=1 Tax=Meloidogyne enterolobii TaxID=390850 RepID=A0ACB0ZQK3_MELEN
MAPSSSKRSKSSSKSKHNALSSASLRNFFKLEDELSKHLDTDKIGDDVRKILAEIRSNLNSNQDKHPTHSKSSHERSSALILAVKLRNINRLFTFRNKQANTKLAEVRQKVEDHYLSLQNVSSEIAHMKKNIETCLDFRFGGFGCTLAGGPHRNGSNYIPFDLSQRAESNGTILFLRKFLRAEI